MLKKWNDLLAPISEKIKREAEAKRIKVRSGTDLGSADEEGEEIEESVSSEDALMNSILSTMSDLPTLDITQDEHLAALRAIYDLKNVRSLFKKQETLQKVGFYE